MGVAKIAVSLDEAIAAKIDQLVREGKFPSRSKLIQEAVAEKLQRMGRTLLAAECAKLDREFERALAEEGLSEEAAAWPEY